MRDHLTILAHTDRFQGSINLVRRLTFDSRFGIIEPLNCGRLSCRFLECQAEDASRPFSQGNLLLKEAEMPASWCSFRNATPKR
jgi:hypothetical protein